MIRNAPTKKVSNIQNHKEEDKLLELNFHTKRDIILKNVSPYSITIPLKHVQRNNVKPETRLYNLMKTLNWNDTSNRADLVTAINLKPLSERFLAINLKHYLLLLGSNRS